MAFDPDAALTKLRKYFGEIAAERVDVDDDDEVKELHDMAELFMDLDVSIANDCLYPDEWDPGDDDSED